MTVVGAGVIGVEYASMFGALGTKVTVVDKRDRVLAVPRRRDRRGVPVPAAAPQRDVPAARERRRGRGAAGAAARGSKLASGKEIVVRDRAVRGRAPGRHGRRWGSSATGLEADKRGRIKVDDDYRTAVPHIFAVGDVAGGGLAATAMEQGRIAALHAFDQPVDALPELIPTGVYAIPEIGMVGRTEEELTDAAVPYVVGDRALDASSRAALMTGDERRAC